MSHPQFGLSISGMVHQPRDGDMCAQVDEIVAWAAEARDLGFSHIVTGQHYLSHPYQYLQPIALLARLAPITGDMLLVPTILVPLHHPIDLAEQLATLDVITGGRLAVNAARGYRETEFRAFGVRASEATGRMIECLDCLPRLWSGKPVTYNGRYFGFDQAATGILPVQRPHPPIWVAANADAAVERAGRSGLPWNINGHADFPTIERQVALYREEARRAGHDGNVPLPLSRELYCAETREQAVAEAGAYLAAKYESYSSWGQDQVLPDRTSFRRPFEDLVRDRFILGDPDDCAREIRRYQALGVDKFQLRMAWPGMPSALARRSLHLFAREVIPRFRPG